MRLLFAVCLFPQFPGVGSSRHSVNASLSGNSVSTPSPPVRTSLLSTGSASFNHQISTGSTGVTASHMLDVSNIRLHLYDAHIDDDSVCVFAQSHAFYLWEGFFRVVAWKYLQPMQGSGVSPARSIGAVG